MPEPLTSDATVLVVGASLAGLRAAEEIRHEGHRGPVIVVGDERHAPYDRPPLSKQFLAGVWGVERIHHHAPDALDTLGLEFRLGHRAAALDASARVVAFEDGTELAYDGLIIATGARARRLPGTDGVAGVFTLRTLDDGQAIRARLAEAGTGARVVVIGAGFIGLEVAATCHGLGSTVTVVETLPTPMARVLGPEMGAACARLHRDQGVEIRAGVGVAAVTAGRDGSSPVRVRLSDGTDLDADLVVVGIGIEPEVDWVRASSLTVDDGVVCSETLLAGERVVAAGDVARWFHRSSDASVRLEHWTHAAESGAAAARNLLAGPAAAPYDPVPFFWSDQYKTKIQMIGLPDPDDEVVVVSGSAEEGKLVALYRRGERLAGVLAFSQPRQLMGYRPLLAAGASFDEALALSRA